MIKSIEIIINNNIYLFDVEKKSCFFNEKKYKVTDKYIDDIKHTILYWKKEYGTSNVLDMEEFTVKVYSNEGIDTYHGKGIYPDNHDYFKELLGEFNG